MAGRPERRPRWPTPRSPTSTTRTPGASRRSPTSWPATRSPAGPARGERSDGCTRLRARDAFIEPGARRHHRRVPSGGSRASTAGRSIRPATTTPATSSLATLASAASRSNARRADGGGAASPLPRPDPRRRPSRRTAPSTGALIGYVLDEGLRAAWDDESWGRRTSGSGAIARAFVPPVAADRCTDRLDVDAMLSPAPAVVRRAGAQDPGRAHGRPLVDGWSTGSGPSSATSCAARRRAPARPRASAARLLLVQPCPPAATTRIEVLGPLRVRRDGVAARCAGAAPPCACVSCSRCSCSRERVRRDRAIDLLWPDHGAARRPAQPARHAEPPPPPARARCACRGEASYHLRSDGEHLQLVRSPALRVRPVGVRRAPRRGGPRGVAGRALGPSAWPPPSPSSATTRCRDADELGRRRRRGPARRRRLRRCRDDARRAAVRRRRAPPRRRRGRPGPRRGAVRGAGASPGPRRGGAGGRRGRRRAGPPTRLRAALDDLGVAPEPETAIALRHATDLAAAAAPSRSVGWREQVEQVALAHLAGRRPRQLVDEHHLRRHLVAGEVLAHVVAHACARSAASPDGARRTPAGAGRTRRRGRRRRPPRRRPGAPPSRSSTSAG